MERYPLQKTLKDGTQITIRKMLDADDVKSHAFFNSLPEEDRQYLRMDVTKMEYIRMRMDPGPFQSCWRLVAEKDDQLYGDGTICGYNTGWMRHIAEIRCIVHPEYQRKGLGSALLWELFQKTLTDKIHMVFCDVVPEQKAAISVLEKLGFRRALVRKDHVQDIRGKQHDLLTYVKNVQQMWDTLKAYMDGFDFDISIRH